jgi:hypothetical protein
MPVSTPGGINPHATSERVKRRNWQKLAKMLTSSLITIDSEGVLSIPDVETLTTSLTTGSVVFSDGTNLAQDNANLFWDDSNNRLGVNTASPLFPLHVAGQTKIDGAADVVQLLVEGSGSQSADPFRVQTAAATPLFNITRDGGAEIPQDNQKLFIGAGLDSAIYYDGTNMVIDPMIVGTGYLKILHDEDADDNEVMRIHGNERATAADGDEAHIGLFLDNSAGTPTEYARLLWRASDVTDGTEDARLDLSMMMSGTLRNVVSLQTFASGLGNIVLNEFSRDINLRVESNNNANMLFMDGGLDTLTIGSATSLGLFGIDGQSDEVQCLVQGNGTQTSDIFVVEKSGGGNIFTVGEDKLGFYGTASAAQPTGVAVSAAGIHAALVTLGLITA